jgi:class 3 adenylate cyclase
MTRERRVARDMAVTENITVLFTDLVGSTELSSGLWHAAFSPWSP